MHAVVGKSRLLPDVGSTTKVFIIVEDHVCRNIGDGRQFVVQNGQLEGGLGNVSGRVGDSVGHQGDTHRECGTGLIIHIDGDIVTVVGEAVGAGQLTAAVQNRGYCSQRRVRAVRGSPEDRRQKQ